MECNPTIYKEKLIIGNPSKSRDLLRSKVDISVLMNHHQVYEG